MTEKAKERINKELKEKTGKLNLYDCGLDHIPTEIVEMTWLSVLDLGSNQLSTLPESISQLSQLSVLYLGSNQLSTLPESITQLSLLTRLSLSNNQLSTLPESITQLSQLTKLYLNRNQLSILPESITQLRQLRELDLSRNQLSILPDSITQLSLLTRFYLSDNQLSTLPESITQLRQLKELYLNENQLSTLPESIAQLSLLMRLNLNGNQLGTLPDSITQLSLLTRLDLSSNQLSTLPDSITQLRQLRELYLSSNQLNTLPESITQLSQLTELYLSSNQLSTLPDSITQLSLLTRLDLSSNQLSTLPESITQLSQLTKLYLNNNQLNILPESITQLNLLTRLDLSSNQLSILPSFITQLNLLARLDLGGNPLQRPPIEIASRGLKAIKEYFETEKQEESSRLFEAKLLVVGEGGAGKTSLCNKILNAAYELQPENKDISTEGIDILRHNFTLGDGTEVFVNLWDFGGQEIYHSTHQFFLTKRSLYALVTDSRKDDTDLRYWLNVQQLLAEDSPIIIIQNEKQDRIKDLNKPEIRERFENVKEFLRTNLKDNRGLPEIVKRLELEIQALPHIGDKLPKSWVDIRKELETIKADTISLDTYLDICKQFRLKEASKALLLSGYLHDLGVLLHFQEDPILQRIIILKNEWGTSAVYKVIDDPRVKENKGRFTFADLCAICQEEKYVGKQLELITLMEKFKLCYKIPNTDTYITPARLPVEKPSYEWDTSNNMQLRYHYKFMPKGILTRFIVEMHEHIQDQETVWKSGVVLSKDNTLVEVIEIYGEDEIRVRIKGENPERLRPLVVYQLDKINATFHNLEVEKRIPCNCNRCSTNEDPAFYTDAELLDFKKYNRAEIPCRKPPFDMTDIRKLLNDFSIGIVVQSELVHQAKELISKGKLEDTFELLDSVNYRGLRRKNDLILYRSKFNELKSQQLQNLISRDNYTLELGKITKGVLHELDNLKEFSL